MKLVLVMSGGCHVILMVDIFCRFCFSLCFSLSIRGDSHTIPRCKIKAHLYIQIAVAFLGGDLKLHTINLIYQSHVTLAYSVKENVIIHG